MKPGRIKIDLAEMFKFEPSWYVAAGLILTIAVVAAVFGLGQFKSVDLNAMFILGGLLGIASCVIGWLGGLFSKRPLFARLWQGGWGFTLLCGFLILQQLHSPVL